MSFRPLKRSEPGLRLRATLALMSSVAGMPRCVIYVGNGLRIAAGWNETAEEILASLGEESDAGRLKLEPSPAGFQATGRLQPRGNKYWVLDLGHVAAFGAKPRSAEGLAVTLGENGTIYLDLPDFAAAPSPRDEPKPEAPKALPAVQGTANGLAVAKVGGALALTFAGRAVEVGDRDATIALRLAADLGTFVERKELIRVTFGARPVATADTMLTNIVSRLAPKMTAIGLSLETVRGRGLRLTRLP